MDAPTCRKRLRQGYLSMEIVKAYVKPRHQVIWECLACEHFQAGIPYDHSEKHAVPCPECGDATEEGLNRGRVLLVPAGYLFVMDDCYV